MGYLARCEQASWGVSHPSKQDCVDRSKQSYVQFCWRMLERACLSSKTPTNPAPTPFQLAPVKHLLTPSAERTQLVAEIWNGMSAANVHSQSPAIH